MKIDEVKEKLDILKKTLFSIVGIFVLIFTGILSTYKQTGFSLLILAGITSNLLLIFAGKITFDYIKKYIKEVELL